MTRIGRVAMGTALAIGLAGGTARAEQKLGVEVYPGAELLPARSADVSAKLGAEASCYRTSAAPAAVRTFYGPAAGFVPLQGGVLRRAEGVDVVLQTTPVDARPRAAPRATVFCILPAAG